MKDKKINHLIHELYEEMFSYWRKYRHNSGFAHPYEQKLYDAVCDFRDKEKTWSKE